MQMKKRKLEIIGDFDDAAGIFAEWGPSERFREAFGKSVVKVLESFKKNSRMRVLEVGCGHGTWFGLISKKLSKKMDYVGIDFSGKRVEAAKRLFRKNKNAKFLVADYMEYADGKKYDLIFFIEVFQYFDKKDFAKLFEKTKGMLKKEGCAVIIDKDRYSAHSLKIFLGKIFKKLPYYYRHVHYPSFSSLEKLGEASGMNIIKKLKVREFNAIVMKN
jgi:cyclopropane fatty-acyl-phospholipid synthase-like methyltransferase